MAWAPPCPPSVGTVCEHSEREMHASLEMPAEEEERRGKNEQVKELKNRGIYCRVETKVSLYRE